MSSKGLNRELVCKYIGPRLDLKGKQALVHEDGEFYLVQFDDTNLKEGFGWHKFPASDFEVLYLF